MTEANGDLPQSPAVGLYLSPSGHPILSEIATTPARPGWATIEVAACGICGTDIAEYRARRSESAAGLLPIGHEVSGVVTHLDPGDREPPGGIAVGAHVIVDPVFACTTCTACRTEAPCTNATLLGGSGESGGLSRRICAPISSLVATPPGLDPVIAALIEPIACATRAATKSAAAQDVVVLGSGFMGLMVATLLRDLRGTDVVVVDRSPARRSQAEERGFTTLADAGDLPAGGAAAVFEATGSPAGVDAAMRAVRRGGDVVVMTQHHGPHPIRLDLAFNREVRLLWTLGAARADLEAAAVWLAHADLGTLPDRRVVTLDEVDDDLLASLAAGQSPKVVVQVGAGERS